MAGPVALPSSTSPDALTCLPVDGVGEVRADDDLADLVAAAVALRDGDILVVTSKAVSKAEDRVRPGSREQAILEETDRVVARRGDTAIVRTRHGLVMAAAGVDNSNTAVGTVVLLPLDPDASARRIRERLAVSPGLNVAVLVTDTAGRAWRTGQTDIAVGAAGLQVLHDYAGVVDRHGNELAVTAPAVADELASAADLVKRKLDGRPAAVVRGLADLVLPSGSHGPGAVTLVRPESQDMFGLGAREAVLGALRGGDARGFGAPCPPAELVDALTELLGDASDSSSGVRPSGDHPAEVVARLGGTERAQGAAQVRVEAAAFALGWRAVPDPARPPDGTTVVRLVTATP